MTDFSTAPECFDMQDVEERITELESIPTIEREEDEQEELDALYELQEEASGFEQFINESEFTSYVEEFAKDCGYISDDFPAWIKIDWDETADEVRIDYTEFEFRGETFLAR